MTTSLNQTSILKAYGKLGVVTALFGILLWLDDLFARPIAFVLDISSSSLVEWEAALFLVCLSLLVAKVIKREVYQGFVLDKKGTPVPPLVEQLTTSAIVFIGFLLILAFVFKRDITAFLTTGGIGLMVIALALRDMLLGAFTGVLLNLERPFKPGDMVRLLDKFQGRIVKITWRTVVINNVAGETIVVPNVLLANAVIVNLDGEQGLAKSDIQVLIDYDTSIESAERILYASVLRADDVALRTAPMISARKLEKEGILYEVSFTVNSIAQVKRAEHAIIKSILNGMRDAGIGIAIPKTGMIHLKNTPVIADRSLDSFYLVQQCRIFSYLPEQFCKRIAEMLIPRHVARGETIVEMNQMKQSLFLVGEGMVKRMITNQDGSGIIQQNLISTEFFGRRALFYGQSQAATVSAETNVLIYELTHKALSSLMLESTDNIMIFSRALATWRWHVESPNTSEIEPDEEALAYLINVERGKIEAFYTI